MTTVDLRDHVATMAKAGAAGLIGARRTARLLHE